MQLPDAHDAQLGREVAKHRPGAGQSLERDVAVELEPPATLPLARVGELAHADDPRVTAGIAADRERANPVVRSLTVEAGTNGTSRLTDQRIFPVWSATATPQRPRASLWAIGYQLATCSSTQEPLVCAASGGAVPAASRNSRQQARFIYLRSTFAMVCSCMLLLPS